MSNDLTSRSQAATADPLLERALLAVGKTRALGLHFYGHFVGLGAGRAHNGESTLSITGDPPGIGADGISAVALATVADLALGGAIRSFMDRGSRLGTASLSIRHPETVVSGLVYASGHSEPSGLAQRGARGMLTTADGTVIGSAQGWFAALPPPVGWVQRPMPWEYEELPSYDLPSLDELDERERAAVAGALAAGERARARGTAVSEELLSFAWEDAPAGQARGELQIGPVLANRVGHIQGGALYGAAALVAARAQGTTAAHLIDGHYQFLRPADGAVLRGEATVLRGGRLASFVESRLLVDGVLVGAGLYTFRG